MKKPKKKLFITKLKDAIFKFDEYKNFATEKTWTAIKYLIKMVIIVSIIIAIAINAKIVKVTEKIVNDFVEKGPEFSFSENELVIDGENKSYIDGYENVIGVIVNSEVSDIEEIKEVNDYENYIVFLKDKVIIKGSNLLNNLQDTTTYEELNKTYELKDINKQTVVDYFLGGNFRELVFNLLIICFIAFLFVYFIEICTDILILFILGFLISRIIGIKIKNKPILNMSIYSMSLSVVLLVIYIVVQTSTGFNIIYFDIAYRSIAYIYLITALFIIKSELIKQNIELKKIIEVQKQVHEELEKENEEEKEEEQDKQETKKKEKDKDKKEKNNKGEEPQGNQA